jgi:hypothetical protein
MDDERIWSFERDLWIGDPDLYEQAIDEACLMVLPAPPFVFTGAQAIAAVEATPRWEQVAFAARRVSRPQEGLIVAAYQVRASAGGREDFEAHCTTTYRRLAHEDWRVIQHQQSVAPSA